MDWANILQNIGTILAIGAALYALRAKRTDVQSRVLTDLEAAYKRVCEERDRLIADLDTAEATLITARGTWDREREIWTERLAKLEVNGEELRRERIRKDRKTG